MKAAQRAVPAEPPSAAPRPHWRWIFGLALLVRLLVVYQLRDSALTQRLVGDGRAYDEWARRIAGGDWIGHEPFFLAPLYAWLLGALYWCFGPHWTLVRVLQA